MLETMLITFREGLEAFLIVAITMAYLANTGRSKLLQPVYAGIVVALALSIAGSVYFGELAEDEHTEGFLALTAGVLVASLTFYVMKTAHHFKRGIHEKIDVAVQKSGPAAIAGIFAFTVLMISREGMETALMLGNIAGSTEASELLAGAGLGLSLVAIIGMLWVTQSDKINIGLFLQTTGVFLILLCAHLLIYGIHELSEVGFLPFGYDLNYKIHVMTEPFGHDALFTQIITYSLIAVPCAWLIVSYARDRFFRHEAAPAE